MISVEDFLFENKMKKIQNSRSAFTLIEIMVAIAIVGILAAVVLVSMNSFADKARTTRALAQASSVVPSMISCAGNGGTVSFAVGNICTVITGASNYGAWPTWPSSAYTVADNDPVPYYASSSDWVFRVTVDTGQTPICCNSAMNGCGQASSCDAATTW
jgi:prepilin-type N-terminal cleavage/methylation domain-containing protein